jgi:oxygen-independent coproporphyrinogen-3 oxidase
MKRSKMSAKAIYIHIPFCSKKCYYCDFTTFVPNQERQIRTYLEALGQEMEEITKAVTPPVIETIFIGGGTPSIFTPSQMEFLLRHLKKSFPQWAKNYEFTVEANPETTTPDLLSVMHEGGVNRISFGAQTFNQEILSTIGRVHGVEEIRNSFWNARKAGFVNLSLDLMFGLPHQTLEDLKETLKKAIELDPDHLSCYSLKVEEGTHFYALQRKNELPLPSEDHEFEMYQMIRSFLHDCGYVQYEISNFAKAGKESKHNQVYWRNEEYYGLGIGAHGYLSPYRYENIKDLSTYADLCNKGERPIKERAKVSVVEDQENFMILGLRLREGVSKRRYYAKFQQDVFDVHGEVLRDLDKRGLIDTNGDNIILTEKGILFGNDVFASFL